MPMYGKSILVVDKPAGLLTIATEKEREKTAYYMMTDYVRIGQKRNRSRIFIVHRLDRDTSGLLVFAKSEEVKYTLQTQWDKTHKTYAAVVHGQVDPPSDRITSYLAEGANYAVFSTSDPNKGKLSHTDYTVLKQGRHLALVQVALLTGRKHQIRVHLADRGFPIFGDERYGNTDDHGPRLALHAMGLSFPHPITGERVQFKAKIPPLFRKWVEA